MDLAADFDGPASLEFRVKHYEERSKAQAVQIVELEAKVAYLEKCLREGHAKPADYESTGSIELPTKTTGGSPYQLAETRSKVEPDAAAQMGKRATTTVARSGSAEDPLVVEDSDDEAITAPPLQSAPLAQCGPATPSLLQCPPSPQKRKFPLEPENAPLLDLLPRSWGVVNSPRKKPKLSVEVLIPSRPRPSLSFRITNPPCKPSELQTRGHGTNGRMSSEILQNGPEMYADTRPLTPLSPLSPSPSMPPVRGDFAGPNHVVEDHRTFEAAQIAVIQADAREQSRELSYLDDPSEPPDPDTVQADVTSSDSGAQAPLVSQPGPVPGPALRDPPRIQDRLVGRPRFTIPTLSATLQTLVVSRDDMHQQPWGLHTQKMCVWDQQNRNYMFPKYCQNPYLPSEPGCPGLLYRANDKCKWKAGNQAVFTGLERARFRYVGEYSLILDGPMSPAEYRSWSKELKSTWANSILKMAKFKEIRARSLLCHEQGRQPTAQEVAMAIKSKKFDNLKGKKKKAAMTVIIDAYERGDEHMAIWRMECVGFDQNLLQRIVDVIDEKATH